MVHDKVSPSNILKKRNTALRKAAELFYEMGKAEIGEVATHLAQQFLLHLFLGYQAGYLCDNMKNNVFPHGYCVVALHGKTSMDQLDYEERVFGILLKKSAVFL